MSSKEPRKLSFQDLDDLDEYLEGIGDEPMAWVHRETVVELSRLARESLRVERAAAEMVCEKCGSDKTYPVYVGLSPTIVCSRCGYSWKARPTL